MPIISGHRVIATLHRRRLSREHTGGEPWEEKTYRDTSLWVAVALSLPFGALPAAAQTTGVQRTRLLAEDTSQLPDLLFGPGVVEE